ncbi:gamma-tubulin complex component, putative, partial [Ixodes scapularis]
MHFQDKLDMYHLLFPALLDLVNAVKAGEVHGCSILETVHKHSISGIPIVRDSMNIILHKGYAVLVHQINCWMLHGMLRDPYAEFFVHRLSEGSSPCKAVGSSNPSSVRPAPSKVSLESMDNFGLEPRLLP